MRQGGRRHGFLLAMKAMSAGTAAAMIVASPCHPGSGPDFGQPASDTELQSRHVVAGRTVAGGDVQDRTMGSPIGDMVRGAIAGALKKKLGLDVVSEKVEGRGRVYRIAE